MIFAQTLRNARTLNRMTQTQLATRAGVSLATIQNLERGIGNPELSTLQSLAHCLGLELVFREKAFDLDDLIKLGLPLQASRPMSIAGSFEALIQSLGRGTGFILSLKHGQRDHAAMVSFLVAISDHYPSVWNRLPGDLISWALKQRKHATPKLRRLALTALGTYL